MVVAKGLIEEFPLAPFVRRLQLHSSLSEADIEALRALPCTIEDRPKHAHLVREGMETRRTAILMTGFAHRYRVTSEGTRQILTIYVQGDPVDLDHLFLPEADDAVQTLQSSSVAFVARQAMRDLMSKHRAIADAIIRSLLVDSSIFREWTLNIGRRDARKRIAHFLCEIATRLEAQGIDPATSQLPLTQDHIADATGLTAVHVNRTLSAMRAEGLIGRKGALVLVPDGTALQQIADFDPRYLHIRAPDPSSAVAG